VWFFTSSCTLSDGTTSQGMTQPSMTPEASASGTCGTGMPIALAPRP
jgi:hypothetical protein